jgi:hypothetical protein
MAGLFHTVHDQGNGEGRSMMDLHAEGRDVRIRLRDDVWQLEEPGTLYLTRDQAIYLRAHLDAFANAYLIADEWSSGEPEDG